MDVRRLTGRDGVAKKVPVGGRRTLETGVVRFGDERPVGEVVHVRMFPDERDVDVHEHVQPPCGVVAGLGERDDGLIDGALEPGSGDGGKEPPLVAEVNVGCLMADPQPLGDAPETQVLRRLIGQQSQRRLHKAFVKPFVGGLNVFDRAHAHIPFDF